MKGILEFDLNKLEEKKEFLRASRATDILLAVSLIRELIYKLGLDDPEEEMVLKTINDVIADYDLHGLLCDL